MPQKRSLPPHRLPRQTKNQVQQYAQQISQLSETIEAQKQEKDRAIRQAVSEKNAVWVKYFEDQIGGEPGAQLLYRIISYINVYERSADELLDLYQPLTERDKEAIRTAQEILGIPPETLQSGKMYEIALLTQKVKSMIDLPASHPLSVEGRLYDGNFDEIARSNLDWLVKHRFSELGGDMSQAILDSIVAHINTRKILKTPITLATRFLTEEQKIVLLMVRERLGASSEVLDDPVRVMALQNALSNGITLPHHHPESLEALLKNISLSDMEIFLAKIKT